MIDNKIYKDYLNFFTGSSLVDMLPYAYMGANSFYDEMILNNQHYYLFKDEVKIIKDNKALFTSYLAEITDLIEIGPGPYYTIDHKTLPLIRYSPKIKRYYALDISSNYLDDACNFIKNELPNLSVHKIVADITQQSYIDVQNIKGRKCIIFLGGTIGNFDISHQYYIIRQIANVSNFNDLFIMTVDTNTDRDSLVKAYSNHYTQKFLVGILKYFAEINPAFEQYVSHFNIECEWNEDAGLIDICFVALDDMVFDFQNVTITISKGQKFYGIKSRKLTSKKVRDLLCINNFKIIEVLNNLNKMQIFISKKC